jgi:hypothetical protein
VRQCRKNLFAALRPLAFEDLLVNPLADAPVEHGKGGPQR